jgi:hypothetical protein
MDKIQEFRRPYMEKGRRLATLMGRPFVDAYECRLADQPKGAIALFFYGNDRIGLVEHDGDGNYHTFAFTGKTREIELAIEYATRCFEATAKEG